MKTETRNATAALLLALSALLPMAACAQAAPGRDAGAQAQPLPAWEQLTPAQREELVAPLRARWDDNPDERPHMLERARRWHAMPPEQRARAHHGMKRWEHMDPAKRAEMRALFERTRGMSKQQRRETFALYHEMRKMTPDQREALKQRWVRMTPDERKAWMHEHAPRRKVHIKFGDGHGPPPD